MPSFAFLNKSKLSCKGAKSISHSTYLVEDHVTFIVKYLNADWLVNITGFSTDLPSIRISGHFLLMP